MSDRLKTIQVALTTRLPRSLAFAHNDTVRLSRSELYDFIRSLRGGVADESISFLTVFKQSRVLSVTTPAKLSQDLLLNDLFFKFFIGSNRNQINQSFKKLLSVS